MKNFFVLLIFILSACEKKPDAPPVATPDVDLIESGDIVIANNMSDSILLLKANGDYKTVLYNVRNTAETVYGLSWDSINKEVVATIDGSDRVIAINKKGAVRTLIADGNLSGTPLRGVARLLSGDYLVAEDNSVERYSSDGIRIANGWPKSLLNGNTQISPLVDGGFLLCAGNTSRIVAIYSETGTLVASKSFASSALDVTGCIELADGSIAVNLNHATTNSNDRVEVYAADLSGAALMSFADNTNLANPTGIAQRANGNLIISDTALHQLIEINTSGQLVGILNDSITQSPIQILVIP